MSHKHGQETVRIISTRKASQKDMKILRTPSDCFSSLPGYSFNPHYVEDLVGYEGIRIHYLDEGSADSSEIFLCLHGQPTWSYLYRKMIPIFVEKGIRVVAPDLIGFGKSDKPSDDSIYTFEFHRNMLLRFVERLDLDHLTLVCQDWGGLLGLTLPPAIPTCFRRLLVMNTTLATGTHPLTQGFLDWRQWNNAHPDMDISKLMKRSVPHLSENECLAYSAPFPDVTFKAGVRAFPNLVPDSLNAPGGAISREAKNWWKNQWTGTSFMAIGMKDPVIVPDVMRALGRMIKNCGNPYEMEQAGHFVPEWGEAVAREALTQFKI